MCERQINHKILDLSINKRGIKVTNNKGNTETEFSRMICRILLKLHRVHRSWISRQDVLRADTDIVPNMEGGGRDGCGVN